MNWAQLVSLVIEWPEVHEGIECSSLDPNDEDDRRIGIEAAEGIDKRLGDCGVDGIAALGSQQANDGDSINCGN